MLTPEGMVEHLRATLGSSRYKPPLLPSIAIELMNLTRKADVSLTAVRQLLERDSLLAAKVLQLSQSALYSRGALVWSLQDAISRLGLRTLEDLFLQTVLSTRVFRAAGYEQPMATLMRHSTLTAHVARMACRMTSIPDEYAFMCGLLHDAGIAAGLLIFADASVTDWKKIEGRALLPSFEEVSTALLVVHEEASTILAQAWQLAPDVALVIGHHHHFRIGGRVHPLAAAVCVADWVATELGTAVGDESLREQAEDAARELGFGTRERAELLTRGRELADLI
jgi:HD-like signal output (HDOD) protein